MLKNVKGKTYDTDKAQSIGTVGRKEQQDADYMRETLFKKRTGEYFLFGEGGEASKYAVHLSHNKWSEGKIIIPLSYAEAKDWAKRNLIGEEYDSEFGEIAENHSKTHVCISVSKFTAEKLKRKAQKLGMTVSALIEKFSEES